MCEVNGSSRADATGCRSSPNAKDFRCYDNSDELDEHNAVPRTTATIPSQLLPRLRSRSYDERKTASNGPLERPLTTHRVATSHGNRIHATSSYHYCQHTDALTDLSLHNVTAFRSLPPRIALSWCKQDERCVLHPAECIEGVRQFKQRATPT